MIKKGFKYFLGALLAIIVLYNSVYFQPLDEKLSEESEVVFDADALVNEIWQDRLFQAFDSAVEYTTLFHQLKSDPKSAFGQHANALAIGNIGCFRVRGEGIVKTINQNNVLLDVSGQTVEIETEFIFGNAVRDASRLIQVSDFDRTSDLNSISESINDKIRHEVIPDFRNEVKVGDRVAFSGAIELNQAHLNLAIPEIIPVSIKIIS